MALISSQWAMVVLKTASPGLYNINETKDPEVSCDIAWSDYTTNIRTEVSRFDNIPLKSLKGEIYTLCKDQHGCRYLQKKLEERTIENIKLIYNETQTHMVELMTGKSGVSFYQATPLMKTRSFRQLPLPEVAGVL